MVNFIETLFGLAALSAIAALISLLRRRRPGARKFGVAALAFAVLGGILEVYLRVRA